MDTAGKGLSMPVTWKFHEGQHQSIKSEVKNRANANGLTASYRVVSVLGCNLTDASFLM